MWAAGYGHTATVRLLLDQGADPDLRDDRGMTALMMAAEAGSAGSIEALLRANAQVTLEDALLTFFLLCEELHTQVHALRSLSGPLNAAHQTALGIISENRRHKEKYQATHDHRKGDGVKLAGEREANEFDGVGKRIHAGQ